LDKLKTPYVDDILKRLSELFAPSGAGFLYALDILVVAFLVYRLLKLVQGRRAWTLLMGIAVFVLVLFVSERLQLRTLHWLLEKATILAPVALVILLLPELRAAIEGLARVGLWPERFLAGPATADEVMISEVAQAARAMAEESTGAIIVIERTESLDDVARTGVTLKAQVTSKLLQAIFYSGNPLHDGAALIRQDMVLAAACRLPLSESLSIDPRFHMRHRAGVGITEGADAVVVIVSEERGGISLAVNGHMMEVTDPSGLEDLLREQLVREAQPALKKGVFRRKFKPDPETDPPAKAQEEPL
jgi:diadenylate cyclase